MIKRPGLRGFLVLGATLALLFSACGDGDRPSVAEWRPAWEGVIAEVPSAAELGDPPDRALCSAALGVLRTKSAELSPTPDLAIDSVVTEWVRVAEDLLFECPPSSDRIPNLAFAYDEMLRLEVEVEAVLAIDDPAG